MQQTRFFHFLFEFCSSQLQQEMEEHHGHINSVCFDTDDGQKMYSADSLGTIIIWNVYVTEQAGRKREIYHIDELTRLFLTWP